MKPRGVIDIESFPGVYRSYGDNMYETSLIREEKPVTLASFSYKEVGKNKTYTRGVWEFPDYVSFVEDMHKVFLANGVLIGHNAKKFDLRQSNTFFAQYGLRNTGVEIEDTLKVVRRNFKLPSYSLKYCLKFFGLGEKLETGGDILWKHAEEGCECKPNCRKKFLDYNKNDTVRTEMLYEFLRSGGWLKTGTRKFYTVRDGCVRCGGHNINWRGEKPLKDGWHAALWCKDCNKHQCDELVIRSW